MHHSKHISHICHMFQCSVLYCFQIFNFTALEELVTEDNNTELESSPSSSYSSHSSDVSDSSDVQCERTTQTQTNQQKRQVSASDIVNTYNWQSQTGTEIDTNTLDMITSAIKVPQTSDGHTSTSHVTQGQSSEPPIKRARTEAIQKPVADVLDCYLSALSQMQFDSHFTSDFLRNAAHDNVFKLKQWVKGLSVLNSFLHEYTQKNCQRDYSMIYDGLSSSLKTVTELECLNCLHMGASTVVNDIRILLSVIRTNVHEGNDMDLRQLIRLLNCIVIDWHRNLNKLDLTI